MQNKKKEKQKQKGFIQTIMFNTLASYLLGSTSNSDNNTVTEENNDLIDQLNLTTTTCEEDDDWLLVVEKTKKQHEEEDSLTRTDSEEELPIVAIKNSPKNNSKQRNRNGKHKFIKMAAIGNSMEESWFVTPPPCFTSTGPIQIQTSPLENLLIEHPSMSVYHSLRSGDGIYEDDDNIVLVDFDFGTIESHPAADRTHVSFAKNLENILKFYLFLFFFVLKASRVARNDGSSRRSDRVDHLSDQESKQIALLKNAQKVSLNFF